MGTDPDPATADWVLVVEDEPDVREIICLILQEHGVRATGAADGLEALERARNSEPPGLVLLDLMMPRMDGWQFRAAQLSEPELAGIPVLVLSGDGNVEAKAGDLAAAGFLRKPVDLEVLVTTVHRHLRREGARRGSRT
jgi:CheY-like chemotaxis protein